MQALAAGIKVGLTLLFPGGRGFKTPFPRNHAAMRRASPRLFAGSVPTLRIPRFPVFRQQLLRLCPSAGDGKPI